MTKTTTNFPLMPQANVENERNLENTPSTDIVVAEETIGSSLWRLHLREMEFSDSFISDIHSLSSLSGGVNLFFESEFQAAAQNRIMPPSTQQIFLTETLGEETAVRLYFPVNIEKAGFPPKPVFRAASHPYAPLSLPLVERDDIDEISDRFAGLFSKLSEVNKLPVLFEDFPYEEFSARKLTDALAKHGFQLRVTSEVERAILHPIYEAEDPGEAFMKRNLTSKRRRQLNAQLRKLREIGSLDFEKATDFESVLTRFEEFLLLELRGWKGQRRTAMHAIRKTAAFARQAVGQLARQRRATVYSMRLDGRSIASLIVLKSGTRYYPWKIAYDENYQVFAPGIQLLMHATKDMLCTPGFSFADSLAAPDSVINRLWSDRLKLGTLIVSANELGDHKVSGLERALDRKSAARNFAKRLLRRS
ncbi:MAG: GNAT family N-acetyltransferase [Pseudomonadota bacterium]